MVSKQLWFSAHNNKLRLQCKWIGWSFFKETWADNIPEQDFNKFERSLRLSEQPKQECNRGWNKLIQKINKTLR